MQSTAQDGTWNEDKVGGYGRERRPFGAGLYRWNFRMITLYEFPVPERLGDRGDDSHQMKGWTP